MGRSSKIGLCDIIRQFMKEQGLSLFLFIDHMFVPNSRSTVRWYQCNPASRLYTIYASLWQTSVCKSRGWFFDPFNHKNWCSVSGGALVGATNQYGHEADETDENWEWKVPDSAEPSPFGRNDVRQFRLPVYTNHWFWKAVQPLKDKPWRDTPILVFHN